MRAERLPGVLLILLGGLLLAVTRTGLGGEVVPAAIGVAFLIAWAATRQYGLLVPGGILTGLGIGILAQEQSGYDGLVVLGLGLGFLLILLGDPGAGRWWPLIPGGILTVIGFVALADQGGWVGDVARWWPALLIVAGVWFLLRPRSEPPAPERPEPPAPTREPPGPTREPAAPAPEPATPPEPSGPTDERT